MLHELVNDELSWKIIFVAGVQNQFLWSEVSTLIVWSSIQMEDEHGGYSELK